MFRALLIGLIGGAVLLGQQANIQPDIAAAREAEAAGDFAKAETIYVKLVSLNKDPVLLERLGLVRHMQNKFKPAADAFSQAVKLNPDLWSSQLFLGIDLYRLNEFAAADDHLTTATRIRPDQSETLFWLGATKLARQDFVPGFQILERVLRRDPANAEVLRLLAESYATFGTSLLNEVGENYPDSPAGLIVQARAFEFEGAYGPALEAYRSAFTLAPDRPGLRESIQRVESRVGQSPAP